MPKREGKRIADLIVDPPEGWKCKHFHSGLEHKRCWERYAASEYVDTAKMKLGGWTEQEIAILLSYRNPNKRVFQVKYDLWKNCHKDRSWTEIVAALDALGISRDEPDMKIGFLDIESTSLKGNFGFILGYEIKEACEHDQALDPVCGCGKPGRGSITEKELEMEYGDAYLPSKAKWAMRHVCHCKEIYHEAWVTRKDVAFNKKLGLRPKDLFVVKKLLGDLDKFDIVVGHNSTRFDLRFIKTRALIWARRGLISKAELKPLEYGILRNVDTLFEAWDNLALTSASQDTMITTFHTGVKTKLDEEAWNDAPYADPVAIKYIANHCRTDVDALEKHYYLLRPFARQPFGRPVG